MAIISQIKSAYNVQSYIVIVAVSVPNVLKRLSCHVNWDIEKCDARHGSLTAAVLSNIADCVCILHTIKTSASVIFLRMTAVTYESSNVIPFITTLSLNYLNVDAYVELLSSSRFVNKLAMHIESN